jgi:hypothetical protein
MDDAFLPLLLRQIFWRRLRLQRADVANVFATLITVIIALWHLGMAERAAFHHRFGFPYDEQSDRSRPLRIRDKTIYSTFLPMDQAAYPYRFPGIFVYNTDTRAVCAGGV